MLQQGICAALHKNKCQIQQECDSSRSVWSVNAATEPEVVQPVDSCELEKEVSRFSLSECRSSDSNLLRNSQYLQIRHFRGNRRAAARQKYPAETTNSLSGAALSMQPLTSKLKGGKEYANMLGSVILARLSDWRVTCN